MPAPRHVGVIWLGQSNQQGATLTDNGGKGFKFVSEFTGQTGPFLLNSNGGGCVWPRLIDHGRRRGVAYFPINAAIGGAAIRFFTGTVGATVGNQGTPIATLNTGGSSLTGGTGVICREGDAGFDPFGLLARVRAEKAKFPQIKEWIGTFANAESDVGTSTASYRDALVSIGDFLLASGCDVYLPGLSASGENNQGSMNALSAGVSATIALMRAQGKRVYRGGDLYARFGMDHPTYPERSSPDISVHLNPKGLEKYADLVGAAFEAAGY